jgi:protein-S-isoprenylcysteine O-methyltransferase Ste14
MAAIWVRALLYLCVVAGGWLVALPTVLLALEHGRPRVRLRGAPWAVLGGLCGASATALGLAAGFHLITRGRGTPLPLDPPRALVTDGPYDVVRNPQAIAMLLAVAGEVAAIRSRFLWILLPLTLIYLEVLVGPWEERDLTARYGEAYLAYKRRVRKWLPRCGERSRTARRATRHPTGAPRTAG